MATESEFNALAREVLATLHRHPDVFGTPRRPEATAAPPTWRSQDEAPLPNLVLASETGLLLGEPPACSSSLALPRFVDPATPEQPERAPGLGGDGDWVWAFGPPFAATRIPQDFLQIVVVAVDQPPSRQLLAQLAARRSMSRHLPGYFAHSEGSATGARLHHQLLARGFSPWHLAEAMHAYWRAEGFCATVALGIGSRQAFALIQPLAERFHHLKQRLAAAQVDAEAPRDGCEGRECASCDEKSVCDKIRAVLAARQRRAGP